MKINNHFFPSKLAPGSGDVADKHCVCYKNKTAFRGRLVFPNTFVGRGAHNTFCELKPCRRLCTLFRYSQASAVGRAVGKDVDHRTLALLRGQ